MKKETKTETGEKEKFQAVFTFRMKKPKFGIDEDTTPKSEIN